MSYRLEPHYQSKHKRDYPDFDNSTNQQGGINIDATSWDDSDVYNDARIYNDNRTINVTINILDSSNPELVAEKIKGILKEKPDQSNDFLKSLDKNQENK